MPSSRSSKPRNWARVSCIAGGVFISWTTKEALRTCIPSPKEVGTTLKVVKVHQPIVLRQNDTTISSVQFSHSIVSEFLWPHGLQHGRHPCWSPNPEVCSHSRPLSHWCHPPISSSVIPFSSCLQFFPASGPFPMSWFFASGGQSIWVSVLPMNIQDLFPLRLIGLISLQSKGLSRVFSNTTAQKHQFFGTQLSL